MASSLARVTSRALVSWAANATGRALPAAVPVGEYDDGGIADPELALHVTPEQ
jgi:hypothetical protein